MLLDGLIYASYTLVSGLLAGFIIRLAVYEKHICKPREMGRLAITVLKEMGKR